MSQTNQAKGAGRWYPSHRLALEKMVHRCMDEAQTPALPGRIVAALAPHAGYVFSGGVAGHVYRAVRDRARAGTEPDLTVVLGFSHRASFPGVALMEGAALETPLGPAPLDEEAGRFLTRQGDRIRFDAAAHGEEHSAENQVPFLQAALPRTKLVIGLTGDHDPRTVQDLVGALNALARDRTVLVVASTDLLHDPDYERVSRIDRQTLDRMARMDDAGLLNSWNLAEQVCCGLAPTLTAIRFAAAQGVACGEALAYRNSGDDHPESRGQWVVGYGAVVYPLDEDSAQLHA